MSYKWETLSIGSDESGKGDFFGAPSIVAVLLDKETLEKLKKKSWFSQIQDSKKCTNEWIKVVAPEIISICKYAIRDLEVEEYLKLYEKYKNMNQLFAIFHNQVHKEINSDLYRVVDDFTNEKEHHYHNYLKEANIEEIKINEFCTKAENKYLSVALASIIARYHFILKIENMSKITNVTIPYGNNYSFLLEAYKSLLKKYSEKEIESKFIKSHFKTLIKLKELIKE